MREESSAINVALPALVDLVIGAVLVGVITEEAVEAVVVMGGIAVVAAAVAVVALVGVMVVAVVVTTAAVVVLAVTSVVAVLVVVMVVAEGAILMVAMRGTTRRMVKFLHPHNLLTEAVEAVVLEEEAILRLRLVLQLMALPHHRVTELLFLLLVGTVPLQIRIQHQIAMVVHLVETLAEESRPHLDMMVMVKIKLAAVMVRQGQFLVATIHGTLVEAMVHQPRHLQR